MVTIRKVLPQDATAIKEMITEIMENEFSSSGGSFPDEDIKDPAGHYSGKNEIFYVAEKDGQIVGTAGIKQDQRSVALLRRLFVKKEMRGKGYGDKLIKEALGFCKEHKYRKVHFQGTDLMKAALRICLKNGFKEKDILVLPHLKMFMLEKKLI